MNVPEIMLPYSNRSSFKMVSVIIPNHNYGEFVGMAVSSVLHQSYSNLEIIVVDNGSTDNSIEILKSFGDRVNLIQQEDRGQANARNVGLDFARGDYLAFLDADDYWEQTKVEKQLAILSQDCQLVYCSVRHFDTFTNGTLRIEHAQFRGDQREGELKYPAVSLVVSGESTALFSRKAFDRVGFLDERLNSSSGWDFFRRMCYATEIDYVPEVLVNYRIHANNMSSNYPKVVSEVRKLYSMLESQSDVAKKKQFRMIRIKLEFSFIKGLLRSKNLGRVMKSVSTFLLLLPGLVSRNPKAII